MSWIGQRAGAATLLLRHHGAVPQVVDEVVWVVRINVVHNQPGVKARVSIHPPELFVEEQRHAEESRDHRSPLAPRRARPVESERKTIVCRGTDQIQTSRRVSCVTVPHGDLERVSLTTMTQPVR